MLLRRCRVCGSRGLRACGERRVWRQHFGDGGWVEWKSWNPCSVHAPGGVVKRTGPLLDECADLDDLSDCFPRVAASMPE